MKVVDFVLLTGVAGAILGAAAAAVWWAVNVLLGHPYLEPSQFGACVVIGAVLTPVLVGVFCIWEEIASKKRA